MFILEMKMSKEINNKFEELTFEGITYLVAIDFTHHKKHVITETDWQPDTSKAFGITDNILTQEERNKLVEAHMGVIPMLL
jgi:hypothetical protein